MELFKKLGMAKTVGIIAAGIVVLVSLVLLTSKLASPPMAVLYSNLSAEDSSLIVSKLQSMDVQHQTDQTGKEILVPVDKVLQLRMGFAQDGLPTSGTVVGYEIFDKTEPLGTSQFVHNINLVRAIEGELSRTISSLSAIESARIHLVVPKKELFSKVGSEPSASVVLRMKGSQALTKPEVASIGHLIATAVPGLKVDNVTIIDHRGRPLKLGANEDGNTSAITDDAADFQRSVEEKLQRVVENLLEKTVGVGKVKANVSAEINFDREVTNSETYDPEGQVVRSKKVIEENEKDQNSSGAVSVQENLPGGAGGGGAGGKSKVKTNEVTNYEISKVITNKISESGRIKQLSIAILVDGNYQIEENEETEETIVNYTPRTEEELEKIKALATSAVGLDPKRGDSIEVVNMRFSEEFAALPQKEDPMAWIQDELQNIVQTIVIGIVIILVILLIVRPVVMRALELRKLESEEEDLQEAIANIEQETKMQEAAAAGAEGGAGGGVSMGGEAGGDDLVDISSEDKKGANLLKQVNELVEKHPDETVSIIRNWLYSND